jgi:hypothetical protein
VKWHNDGITEKTHDAYFNEFGKIFYEQTKRLIDRNLELESKKFSINSFLKEENKKILDDSNVENLIKEVMDHGNFCKECVKYFHGRSDIIERV